MVALAGERVEKVTNWGVEVKREKRSQELNYLLIFQGNPNLTDAYVHTKAQQDNLHFYTYKESLIFIVSEGRPRKKRQIKTKVHKSSRATGVFEYNLSVRKNVKL